MTWWFRGAVILLFLSSGPIVYFRRVRQLKRAQLAQQEVATRLIMSQEAERKRIAAELHDGLGQSLIIIKNRALLGKQSGEDRGMMSEQLDEIASTASAVLDDVRRIAHNLRPVHLERFGLTESIKAMIEGISSTSSISFRSTIDDAGGALSKEDEIHFFRVVQESISNVLKHSGATVADIKVTKADSGILFSLHDNGKGFSEQEVKAGLGLSDIRERVKILNGTFAIESNPGKGTTIKVTVPHSHGASVGA
jgi:signal transduction histidine kinase